MFFWNSLIRRANSLKKAPVLGKIEGRRRREQQKIKGLGGTIDFSTIGWRRVLRMHWTARRSYQSILKEISSEYSLEGLTLKLKLQFFGHLM